jgi:hypothetical protein
MNPVLFETLKPLMPLRLRMHFRRQEVLTRRKQAASSWPIDRHSATRRVGNAPVWPDRKRFAFILIHDVESATAEDRCLQLAHLEQQHGFVSAFNFSARKNKSALQLSAQLRSRGFEIGIRELPVRKSLFRSRQLFLSRAAEINQCLKKWNAVGFRCPDGHFNFNWMHQLEIEYDSSTFDNDPLENASKGMRTIFPFLVRGEKPGCGYIELPATLPQDFTLFILMKELNVEIWKKKLDWIAQNKGMALLVTHPEYMRFPNQRRRTAQYPVDLYEEFLFYVKTRYEGDYWNVIARTIAQYWRNRFRRDKIMKQPPAFAAKSYG